jgi:heparin binding hemagglutinin HbhA
MTITLPNSTDVRKTREQARKAFHAPVELVRTPVLAWIGFNDLAVHTVRELPDKLSREQLRARAEKLSDTARDAYHEWAERGESRVERIRTQPRVARALRGVENLNDRVNNRVDTLVDEAHDAGQELLSAVSFQTRSAGEKTARRTQRVAREVASDVARGGSQLAGEIVEAGDEVARDTRSATRTAANRTAPATPINRRRGAATR